MSRFGEFFKERRISLGLTLREFCLKYGLDPGNISKLERGLLPPPQHEKLVEYAKCLKIKKGSDEWYEFSDLAHSESGTIPDDILSDKEVVDKLPVLFRTLRGEKIPNRKLDQLVRKLKGHND